MIQNFITINQKIPLGSFRDDHLLLGVGLAPKYGGYVQWDSLGDTNFSFVCGYPLEIASWLIMGTHVCFPNLMQEPCLVWSYACLMQAVTCACLCVILYLEDTVPIPFGSYNLSISSSI